VYLIDEKDGSLLVQCMALLSLIDDAAQVGDAGSYRRYRAEVRFGNVGDDVSQSGLAAPRRAPEDDRGKLVSLDTLSQHVAFTQDVILAHELIKVPGPHAGSKGGFTPQLTFAGMLEQIWAPCFFRLFHFADL
jgi:hypothetical protein